jgi:hypothetical protein
MRFGEINFQSFSFQRSSSHQCAVFPLLHIRLVILNKNIQGEHPLSLNLFGLVIKE